ncbi:MAG: SAM-dependent chlorinase/fluorinase [Bacteroidales bacterium]|jgi:S-adenosylmethionine hydrolase|nr:SAM-dependent chlorinase/fluorinase [Bacteroidales bacterium]
MQLLTLTTDWGLKDFYLGKFKGKCHKEIADVCIVDITHEIPKYKTRNAAFVAMNACFDFPSRTIHIIDVAADAKHVIVEWKEQYFICPDNKIPAMMFHHKTVKIYSIDKYAADLSSLTFVAMDLYIDIAKKLGSGMKPEEIGEPIPDFREKEYITSPVKYADYMECFVLYTDDYSNAILNVTEQEFNEFVQDKKFYIQIDITTNVIAASRSYNPQKNSFTTKTIIDSNEAMPALSVSSSGYMELALFKSNYAKLTARSLIPDSNEKQIRIWLGEPKR